MGCCIFSSKGKGQGAIVHSAILFWHCGAIRNFWNNLTQWLISECRHIVNLNLNIENILFGIFENRKADDVLNLIIILAKQFIYKMKYSNTLPDLQHFKKVLLLYYKSEKYIAFTNCNWNKFNQKWLLYKHIFHADVNFGI